MLLFSTTLAINDTLTKDGFIELVLEWNKNSPHEENVIQGIVWDGSHNVRFGDKNMSLEIQEYRNANTIAVRYEKVEADGIVWDTDYVMNFDTMEMAIQLDRSFLADAPMVDLKFSTPYFISLLIEKGYLKDDGLLPMDKRPVFITESNIQLIADVINGEVSYDYPIVFVSKNYGDSDPVDVKKLASRLKGTAHVLVQSGTWLNGKIRKACNSSNEYYGAVGIYFPGNGVAHQRFFYRSFSGYDEFIFDKVIRSVFQYTNQQNVPSLMTWMGVISSMFRDRWSSRGTELIEAEQAKKSAEFGRELAEMEREEAEQQRDEAEQKKDEANKLVEMTDEEIADFKRQIEILSHENERLQAENNGLRTKLGGIESAPIIFEGDEDEFFPGEIKDIVLSVLQEKLESFGDDQAKTRRADVLRDIIKTNGYEGKLKQIADDLKVKMKGYSKMDSTTRRFLEDIGFVITEDGKHYRLTYYGDARYHTTISKTASDKGREGKNIALQIIKDML